jgi:hypothetical protein
MLVLINQKINLNISNMPTLNDFKTKVVDQFCEDITDRVFLTIQNDKDLMQEYLDVLGSGNARKSINSAIAKEIKSRFQLSNQGLKNKEPKSTLIQSHEQFNV